MSQKKQIYTQMKQELDAVIEALQAEDTDIDEALRLYKKANGIIESLNKYLDTVKLEIEHLNKK